jgi:tetratricopeptide (TPR) repeat protein
MKHLKIKMFFLAVISFSSFENVKAQQSENILDSLDIVYLKTFKDSVDLQSLGAIFQIGYQDIYRGNNDRGNRIMEFVFSHIEEPSSELLHSASVQNLKNGNYALANNYLSRAAQINNDEYGYFGWVMLYYYRDYERALVYLDKFDALTPNFSDAPVGENINYLKGLTYLQLDKIEDALENFDKYITETTNEVGEDWVEVSTFYYKGIAHYKLGEYNKAKEAFELAIKYNENYTEAYYYLYLTMKSLNESEDIYYPAIEKAKELADNDNFRRDTYVTYFFPVYVKMIDKEMK